MNGILFESFLRPNDLQNGFHTAKTQTRHSLSVRMARILARSKA